MQKLLGALTAAALFIAAYDNASRFSCCRPQSRSGWRHCTRGARMRPRRVARTLGPLSLHTILRPNARRRLCFRLQRLPAWLLAWPMGSLPQHAVPRKASGRIVVLGRAANNARRARSLHLEAVLDDAGCQPKATIAHLYVQPIRVTNVENVGVLLRLQPSLKARSAPPT